MNVLPMLSRKKWNEQHYEDYLFKKNRRKMNFNSISFPMNVGDVAKFEKDDININVFTTEEDERVPSSNSNVLVYQIFQR